MSFITNFAKALAIFKVPRFTTAAGGGAALLDSSSNVISLPAVKQASGTLVYTGAAVAAGGNIEVPGSGIVVPAGWLQEGDGLDVTLHYELGGTSATVRTLAVAYQPVANVGTSLNVSNIGQLTDSTATPKDGAAFWPVTRIAAGLKRCSIGSSSGLGLNTGSFAATPFASNVDYRFFARVQELANAANSITVYRLTLRRVRP